MMNDGKDDQVTEEKKDENHPKSKWENKYCVSEYSLDVYSLVTHTIIIKDEIMTEEKRRTSLK